jgi:hypothetical protein
MTGWGEPDGFVKLAIGVALSAVRWIVHDLSEGCATV